MNLLSTCVSYLIILGIFRKYVWHVVQSYHTPSPSQGVWCIPYYPRNQHLWSIKRTFIEEPIACPAQFPEKNGLSLMANFRSCQPDTVVHFDQQHRKEFLSRQQLLFLIVIPCLISWTQTFSSKKEPDTKCDGSGNRPNFAWLSPKWIMFMGWQLSTRTMAKYVYHSTH